MTNEVRQYDKQSELQNLIHQLYKQLQHRQQQEKDFKRSQQLAQLQKKPSFLNKISIPILKKPLQPALKLQSRLHIAPNQNYIFPKNSPKTQSRKVIPINNTSQDQIDN